MRPDDLDAIFDGALFGPPELETSAGVSEAGGAVATPVPVGATDWYVERHGQSSGPFRLERLRELWHQGELSPDTLFWCEAWSTWRPLSSVPELVASLTISGLPTVAADAVSSAPEGSKESGSGKKTLSALHSLVEEEEVWLRQLNEAREQAKEEARSARLDEPVTPVAAPAPAPAVQPVVVPVAVAVPLAPVPAQGMPPVAPYPGLGMPMASPAVPGMMAAPEAPEPAQRGKALLAGVLVGSAAVGIVAGALFLLSQGRGSPAQVSARPVAASAAAPRQEAPAVVPSAAPAPVVVAPVVAQAPAPVAQAPVAQASVAQASAPVAPAPVAQAPVTPAPVVQASAPVAKPVPPTPAAATPAPEKQVVKAVTAPQPEKPKPVVVAAASPEVRMPRAVEPAPRSRPQPPAPTAPAKAPGDPSNFEDSVDKEFERELGFSKDAPKFKPEDPRARRNVYIPPEPGKDLPETLSTSDVMQVVGAHKEAILSCIATHAPARMEDAGKNRFVVRWRVLPTGDAVDALMETEELKGTPFARCIEGQVRSWKFPKHRMQGREPVRFPFTY